MSNLAASRHGAAHPALAPRFDPLVFFAGELLGEGRLSVILSGTVPVRVESRGRVAGDSLHLEQRIHEGDTPPRTRHWTLRLAGPGRYVGELTDATGPVVAETQGNRLHIAFPMQGGFAAEQWLTLSPDGRRAMNRMVVRKLGITVAVLAEEIRRRD